MPGTYPPAPPTLSGNLLTIHQLLNDPAYISRRLRTLADLRFVSDQMLTARLTVSGGAVMFETGEAIVTDRTPEQVPPGSSYPFAHTPLPTAGLAAVAKWGQKVKLTDEEVKRHRFPGQLVDKKLRNVVNSIISLVDSLTMSAINSAVTQTFDVTATGGGVWTGATPLFLRDILRAKAVIIKLNLGFVPDTLVLNDTAYAYLMSDEKFTNALRRETRDSPVYTGEVDVIGGLAITVSPSVAVGQAYVLDGNELGGMADEDLESPGYTVSEQSVETLNIRQPDLDAWYMQGRRSTVPVILEPLSAIKLINTGL